MTEIAVLVITPQGEINDEVISTDSDGITLRGLYRLIECQTDSVVRLDGEIDMWVDDEGALNGSLINPFASWVAVQLGAPPQLYLGNALFASFDAEGSTTSLTGNQRILIHKALTQIMTGHQPC